MKPISTTIRIERLQIYAHHGVMPQERVVGNMFELDIDLKVNVETALTNDRLDATVNYGEIVDIVKQEMAIPSNLLEHVTARIVNSITNRFPEIEHGSVSLYKIHPPFSTPVGRVGFEFKW